MAIPCTLKTREYDKFVECPPDSGQVAVNTRICNPEDITGGLAETEVRVYTFNYTIPLSIGAVAISANTIHLEFQIIGGGYLQFNFNDPALSTYFTLRKDNTYEIRNINLDGKILHYRAEKAGLFQLIEYRTI